jgi:predicted membrane-bound spermidine synthase
MRERRILLVGLLFFLSGAAALVYQVAWQRLLALHSGVGLYSVTMIVAAFMAGLGIGSHLGGRASARVEPGGALRLFALLELGIGLFGAASPWLYYDWLYPKAVHLPSPSWQAGALHLIALLPPTVLMGMSLPFLVRAVVTDVAGAGRRIGWLYGTNVLGASFGAFVGSWVLFPRGGLGGAAYVAAGANLIVGLGALLLAGGRREPGPAAPGVAGAGQGSAASPDSPGGRPLDLWLSLYALSGFLALSLEIVWFRLMDVAVKSTSFTFGTVLAVYLLGCGLGSLVAAERIERVRRPLRAFLLAQCALLLLTGLGALALVRLPPSLPVYRSYLEYWAGTEFFLFGRVSDPGTVVLLYVLLPLLLFFVPTLLMGFSFPVLQRAVQDDVRTSGHKVGLLQAANITACMAGSLLVGLAALHWLGTPATLRLLIALGLVFALLGMRIYGREFVPAAVGLALLAGLVPGPEGLWRRLHGLTEGETFQLFEEDATSVVGVTSIEGPGRFRLSVNGKSSSWLPYGGLHTLLGALPALIHPAPTDAAVIGLGSGDSAWAAGCREETRAVTVFEISSPQPRILRRLDARVELLELRSLLGDSRYRLRIADGRHALEAEATLYDLIEIDAIWPEAAGSGNLYSIEFYAAAARRLKPGGVMCTWAPTPRAHASFRAVFPNALDCENGAILIGSPDTVPVDVDAWLERVEAARQHLGRRATRSVRWALSQCRAAGAPPKVSLNRDLFPRDEFSTPARRGR